MWKIAYIFNNIHVHWIFKSAYHIGYRCGFEWKIIPAIDMATPHYQAAKTHLVQGPFSRNESTGTVVRLVRNGHGLLLRRRPVRCGGGAQTWQDGRWPWLSLWLRVGSHTGVAPLWLLFHRGRAFEPVIHPNIVVRKWARNIDTCQLAVRECTLDSGVFGCARTATYVRAVMHALSSFPNERPIGSILLPWI
jgi:hypothetical protein